MSGPNPPLLIFDGDCDFCRLWISYWQQLTCDRVTYRPFQEAEADFPDIPHTAFEKSVQLILPDGRLLTAAHAVFRILAEAPGQGWLLWLYRFLPGFAPISEAVYAWVATHRNFAYHATVWLFGRPEPASYRIIRWVFIRMIGLVYLAAFASMIPQISGLLGENGILPVGLYLRYLMARIGPGAALTIPSVFWIAHSDGALTGAMILGTVIAILVMIGVGQRAGLIALYALYLSLSNVGQDFMSFQWDALLLEAGFLAIFLSPGGWRPRFPSSEPEPPRMFIWLTRWLLFRLMFRSGIVKLASRDPVWQNLTALDYHFWTQPLPTPLGWAAAQLPAQAHAAMTAAMFGIELGVPFLIYMPRRIRFAGAWLMIALQVIIALTGNYTFFNLLTITLCIVLFDDAAIRGWVPRQLKDRFVSPREPVSRAGWKRIVLGAAAAIILTGSASLFAAALTHSPAIPVFLVRLGRGLSSYGITSTYGLFADMTTTREEIVIEGSSDGVTWLAYEFAFKPGDVNRAPPFVAPYQPRLDWQMWFASLGSAQTNPWFGSLMVRLLQGSPEVEGLLAHNPFPGEPPKYIRARMYAYRFSTPDELARSGAWWVQTEVEPYFPEVTLDQLK